MKSFRDYLVTESNNLEKEANECLDWAMTGMNIGGQWKQRVMAGAKKIKNDRKLFTTFQKYLQKLIDEKEQITQTPLADLILAVLNNTMNEWLKLYVYDD